MKLWTWIVEKLLTAKNQKRAIEQIDKALLKLREKATEKKGLADPVSLAIIFAGGMLLGSVFGHGVTTRSVIVNLNDSPGARVENLRVDVSGSGGVSVPMVGGSK